MKTVVRRCGLALLMAALVPAGAPGQKQEEPEEVRLPNGKLQREEILKAEHEKSLRDAARLAELAEALRGELEKNEWRVLSVGSIRKTEEIEKLAKKIRARLRR